MSVINLILLKSWKISGVNWLKKYGRIYDRIIENRKLVGNWYYCCGLGYLGGSVGFFSIRFFS